MKKLFYFTFTIIFLLSPLTANANMIWPSLYIEQGMLSRMVIIPWLMIEYLFIKICTKAKWITSGIMTLTMNALSTLMGVIGIPLSGLAIEILMSPLGGGTFQLSHWIIAYLVAILFNVGIEGLALKWIFKIPFKKSSWRLAIANAISIIICAFLLRFEIIPMK